MVAILVVLCGSATAAQHYQNAGALNTWTTRRVSRVNAPDGQLRIVRAAKQDGFDRVVFEFADGVPSFSVNYSPLPIYAEGTMAKVKISGTAVIVVSFHFYYGEHADIYQGFPRATLNLPELLQIKDIDGTEGVMAFALDLTKRQPFRVQTLSNPARLVVDLKH